MLSTNCGTTRALAALLRPSFLVDGLMDRISCRDRLRPGRFAKLMVAWVPAFAGMTEFLPMGFQSLPSTQL